jgi:DNA-binding NarL/FixJ family response regulator
VHAPAPWSGAEEHGQALAHHPLDGDDEDANRHEVTEHPAVAVLALTTYADDQSVVGALSAGARGYLTKDAGADEIARAIAAVASGQMVLDTAAQLRVVENLRGQPAGTETAAIRSLPDDLTHREAEVLSLIAEGLSNAEIAARLVVSEATVKTHVNHIFAKTGARDRAQAVAYAYRTGLAPAEIVARPLRNSGPAHDAVGEPLRPGLQ